MWLTNSSIGRKFIMALTGAFLVLFVTFHVLMNGVALLWPCAYNAVCGFLGANWYALIGTAILAAGFVLHIIYALILTVENRKARGNDRYRVTTKPKQVEWSSQNMLVLGFVVLAFLAVHMIQFWAKMQLVEIAGLPHADNIEPANGWAFIMLAFSNWWTPVVYIIAFIALWFHMTHGFWSMFQSVGWNNQIWMERIKTIGNWWVTIVVLLFIAEALVFTVKANGEEGQAVLSQSELAEECCDETPCLLMDDASCQDACDATPCGRECAQGSSACAGQCDPACVEACNGCADCATCCPDGCKECDNCIKDCNGCAANTAEEIK